MRSSWLFIGLALVLAIAPACSDDDSGQGGDTGDLDRPDGGGNDTIGDQGPGPDQSPQPDATQDQGGGEPCGDVTFQGECQGDSVIWCACDDPTDDAACRATGQLQEIDCAGFIADEEGTGICSEISDSFGFFCAASSGDACLFSTQEGDRYVELCAGTEPGCVVGDAAQACSENVGACTDDDIATCLGGNVVFDCNVVQPAVIDCTALGGTCDDVDREAACTGLPAGSDCGALLECADGLDCVGGGADSLGTCTTSGGGDGDIDAGGDTSGDTGGDTATDTSDDPDGV